jgi:hypothetical protein
MIHRVKMVKTSVVEYAPGESANEVSNRRSKLTFTPALVVLAPEAMVALVVEIAPKEPTPVRRMSRLETGFEIAGAPEAGVCEKVVEADRTLNVQDLVRLLTTALIADGYVTDAAPLTRLNADTGTVSVTGRVMERMSTACDRAAGRLARRRVTAARKRSMGDAVGNDSGARQRGGKQPRKGSAGLQIARPNEPRGSAQLEVRV